MAQKDIDLAEKELLGKLQRKQVFAYEKTNYHQNILLGGIVKIILIVLFINKFGIQWNEKATPCLKEYLSAALGEETGKFLALGLITAGHVLMFVMFIKGIYQVLIFNLYIDEYEGKNLAGYENSQTHNIYGVPYPGLNTSNIEKVYGYRNSKMVGMTPQKAADSNIKTSKPVGLINRL